MWDCLSFLFVFMMIIFYGSSVRTPLGRILRLSSSKWGSGAPPGAASFLPLVAKGSSFWLSWMFGLFALMLIRWLLGDAAKGHRLKWVRFFLLLWNIKSILCSTRVLMISPQQKDVTGYKQRKKSNLICIAPSHAGQSDYWQAVYTTGAKLIVKIQKVK